MLMVKLNHYHKETKMNSNELKQRLEELQLKSIELQELLKVQNNELIKLTQQKTELEITQMIEGKESSSFKKLMIEIDKVQININSSNSQIEIIRNAIQVISVQIKNAILSETIIATNLFKQKIIDLQRTYPHNESEIVGNWLNEFEALLLTGQELLPKFNPYVFDHSNPLYTLHELEKRLTIKVYDGREYRPKNVKHALKSLFSFGHDIVSRIETGLIDLNEAVEYYKQSKSKK